ncbi:ATP-binding protein [Pelomonas sp. CA6]|uniref:ATP-binding protein n=1 Tax=Pelomonas sp. CA6 TaxID=2907999 RepID=UPI001F4B0ECF|nr:ATP-binding protein [Pelomonas sp. CA6]MCH7342737.1 ATP-binding protein [Pelomonas sp. CA6]
MLRVQREYQSWVANESLEDYALRYAASSYRRWPPRVMARTALGGISFLALEAIGASLTLNYGFLNTMLAVLAVAVVIFLVSLPIARWCAEAHVDIDLLTRGAGFGYIGSTVTSLIYASFTFIFFALETAIWAQALHLVLGLSLPLGYLLCSLAIVPVVFYGVTAISRLQAWTQPFWVAMLLLPLGAILLRDPGVLRDWSAYAGLDGGQGGFNLMAFGIATGVLFSLTAQIGEQADYLRFLPERDDSNRRAWWRALLLAGPGWIGVGALKIVIGSLLAVLALRMGASPAQAVEPVHMFVHAYRQVVDDPALALALAALFVTLSQVKINVTNAYSGSLAWSNCFVRLAHYHPGRVVWLLFNVVIALLLSLLGIFETLEAVLSVYSTVALAWVGALLADLVVLKRMGISPPYIEFKRGHLFNFNPVGCGATVIAAALAILSYLGVFGPWGRAFFGVAALATAFVSAILIGLATRGRYYLARPDEHYRRVPRTTLVECCICQRSYEAPDMLHCPLYRGPMCSLCCGLELHCHDFCKKPALAAGPAPSPRAGRAASASAGSPAQASPPRFRPRMLRQLGRFTALFCSVAALLGVVFLLTYRFMDPRDAMAPDRLLVLMEQLYLATLAVAALGSWWIVLLHEAQERSRRELLESMQHLERTRASLVETEKLASLGGLAAGIAHEINTPVGISVSTASFLADRTRAAQAAHRDGGLDGAAAERYLGEAAESARLLLTHAQRMGQLVSNFKQLAIDRIAEARQEFGLPELLRDTLAGLRPRFEEAQVQLRLELPDALPLQGYPVALAQVLTNLAINALQHAFDAPGARVGGEAWIRVRVQAVADDEVLLEVADNGRGIAAPLHARVFEPFYTTRRLQGGSGLGLYIVNQIVTRQLDGEILLESEPGRGTRFVLRFARVVRHSPDVWNILSALPRMPSHE